jgi:hypothetical protein
MSTRALSGLGAPRSCAEDRPGRPARARNLVHHVAEVLDGGRVLFGVPLLRREQVGAVAALTRRRRELGDRQQLHRVHPDNDQVVHPAEYVEERAMSVPGETKNDPTCTSQMASSWNAGARNPSSCQGSWPDLG